MTGGEGSNLDKGLIDSAEAQTWNSDRTQCREEPQPRLKESQYCKFALLAHFPNLYIQALDSAPVNLHTHLFTAAFLEHWAALVYKYLLLSLRPVLGRNSHSSWPCSLSHLSIICIFSNKRCYRILTNSVMLLNILGMLLLPFDTVFFSPVWGAFSSAFSRPAILKLKKKKVRLVIKGTCFFLTTMIHKCIY